MEPEGKKHFQDQEMARKISLQPGDSRKYGYKWYDMS